MPTRYTFDFRIYQLLSLSQLKIWSINGTISTSEFEGVEILLSAWCKVKGQKYSTTIKHTVKFCI